MPISDPSHLQTSKPMFPLHTVWILYAVPTCPHCLPPVMLTLCWFFQLCVSLQATCHVWCGLFSYVHPQCPHYWCLWSGNINFLIAVTCVVDSQCVYKDYHQKVAATSSTLIVTPMIMITCMPPRSAMIHSQNMANNFHSDLSNRTELPVYTISSLEMFNSCCSSILP